MGCALNGLLQDLWDVALLGVLSIVYLSQYWFVLLGLLGFLKFTTDDILNPSVFKH